MHIDAAPAAAALDKNQAGRPESFPPCAAPAPFPFPPTHTHSTLSASNTSADVECGTIVPYSVAHYMDTPVFSYRGARFANYYTLAMVTPRRGAAIRSLSLNRLPPLLGPPGPVSLGFVGV